MWPNNKNREKWDPLTNVTVGKHDLLPSVFTTALGKDTSLCTLALPSPLARTLAKGEDLPSAFTKALVKVRGFAECLTVMALGKASITITWPSSFFFQETSQHSAKAECLTESTRQIALCSLFLCRVMFAKGSTQQSLCRVFYRLCRVPETLGKRPISRSGYNKKPGLIPHLWTYGLIPGLLL